MYINTNVSAINAHRNLGINNSSMGKTMEKLSSGFRINRAADDAAGLAISEKMRYQINGYNQAIRNAQDGVSLLQTAEGALTEVHSMLQRINTLATQSKNGTNELEDRNKIDKEVQELLKEIDNISNTMKFNGIELLKGSAGTNVGGTAGQVTFQVGFENTTVIDVSLGSGISTTALGLKGATANLDVKSVANASSMMAAVQSAIKKVSDLRATFGAAQNRLEHTINNLGVNSENLSASESRIRNADMATEMTEFTRNQILVQAGTAMLAQANAVPQNVLRLLG